MRKKSNYFASFTCSSAKANHIWLCTYIWAHKGDRDYFWEGWFCFKWNLIAYMAKKDTGSSSDLLKQFYRGTVIRGTWIVSQYFWVIFLSQVWPPSVMDHAAHWSTKTEMTDLAPSLKGAFWAHAQQQKLLMGFSDGSALYLCGELCQIWPTAYGLIQQDVNTTAEGAEDELMGTNSRLVDNSGFVKGKRCQTPTFWI